MTFHRARTTIENKTRLPRNITLPCIKAFCLVLAFGLALLQVRATVNSLTLSGGISDAFGVNDGRWETASDIDRGERDNDEYVYVPLILGQSTGYIIPGNVRTVDGDDEYSHVLPGDRLLIPAGRRSELVFRNLRGEPGRRIVIINHGGQVEIETDEGEAIHIENCQHIQLTGTGDPEVEYGFDLHGFSNAGVTARMGTEYIEIDHLEIHHSSGDGGAGMRAHSRTDDVGDDWVQHDTYIHHVYVHDVNREAFYLGNESDDRGTPYDGLEVAYCRIERIGWEGFQIKNGRDNCYIHHNYAEDVGLLSDDEPNESGAGFIIGPETGGLWYNNTVINAIKGIQLDRHREGVEIFCNLIVHSGYADDGDGIRQLTPDAVFIHHNTIVDSYRDGIHITGSATDGEIWDNIVAESGQVHIDANAPAHHNFEADTIEEVGFVDPENGNYELREDSPARGQASDGGDPGAFPCELD